MGLSVVWIAVGIAVWIAPGARRAGAGPRRTDRAIRIGTEKLMVIGSTVTFAQALHGRDTVTAAWQCFVW